MFERYFVLPGTVDRIRASWLADAIERYVSRLTDRGYAARTIWRRVPMGVHFGDFARQQGAAAVADLPRHVEAFIADWVRARHPRATDQQARKRLAKELRTPIEQLLQLVVPDFVGNGRSRQPENPFGNQAPGFFA